MVAYGKDRHRWLRPTGLHDLEHTLAWPNRGPINGMHSLSTPREQSTFSGSGPEIGKDLYRLPPQVRVRTEVGWRSFSRCAIKSRCLRLGAIANFGQTGSKVTNDGRGQFESTPTCSMCALLNLGITFCHSQSGIRE